MVSYCRMTDMVNVTLLNLLNLLAARWLQSRVLCWTSTKPISNLNIWASLPWVLLIPWIREADSWDALCCRVINWLIFLIVRVIGYRDKLPRGGRWSLRAFKTRFITWKREMSSNRTCWAVEWNQWIELLGCVGARTRRLLCSRVSFGVSTCPGRFVQLQTVRSSCAPATTVPLSPTGSSLCFILCKKR